MFHGKKILISINININLKILWTQEVKNKTILDSSMDVHVISKQMQWPLAWFLNENKLLAI